MPNYNGKKLKKRTSLIFGRNFPLLRRLNANRHWLQEIIRRRRFLYKPFGQGIRSGPSIWSRPGQRPHGAFRAVDRYGPAIAPRCSRSPGLRAWGPNPAPATSRASDCKSCGLAVDPNPIYMDSTPRTTEKCMKMYARSGSAVRPPDWRGSLGSNRVIPGVAGNLPCFCPVAR